MDTHTLPRLRSAAMQFALCTACTLAHPSVISPAVDGSVRGYPDIDIHVLENSVVEVLSTPLMGSRGIIEFSLADTSEPAETATLELQVFSSVGPYPFTIDAYAYAGDGALTLDDWNLGTKFASFEYTAQRHVSLDVKAVLREALLHHDQFLGFNLRFAVPSTIKYNAPFVGFNSLEYPPAPQLRIDQPPPVPEPPRAGLLLTGLLALRLMLRSRATGSHAMQVRFLPVRLAS